jgi:hypothetical protein
LWRQLSDAPRRHLATECGGCPSATDGIALTSGSAATAISWNSGDPDCHRHRNPAILLSTSGRSASVWPFQTSWG